MTQTRLTLFAALALFSLGVLADCREASGGRMQGLKSAVIWHARTACGGSTMLWLQSFAGAEGKDSVWRIADLLIIPEPENAQILSLLAPVEVECRHSSDRESLAIATGEWNRRVKPGERQSIARAWRMDSKSGKIEEVPPRDVTCVLQ